MYMYTAMPCTYIPPCWRGESAPPGRCCPRHTRRCSGQLPVQCRAGPCADSAQQFCSCPNPSHHLKGQSSSSQLTKACYKENNVCLHAYYVHLLIEWASGTAKSSKCILHIQDTEYIMYLYCKMVGNNSSNTLHAALDSIMVQHSTVQEQYQPAHQGTAWRQPGWHFEGEHTPSLWGDCVCVCVRERES